ncbi:hypothetical protein M407DRAFT_24598 [Tulasnella calospora MUT 4182]|uniref:Protein kinase domain-containing protein n=1 Tax=Tulasnella calospora MUT 4182 TaxID=1051891 RepID=A0A0C3QIZ7_9AGAM|nr:hypothetical protein M407DRAFT_24598 [Tulasnella calospora MUT 4182]
MDRKDAVLESKGRPRQKVLESVEDLRIDKARIQPIAGCLPMTGGKSDIERATLLPNPLATPQGANLSVCIAVKKLRCSDDADDDQILALLSREAKIISSLSHKNIVKIIGFVEQVEESIAWMVFSWEENGNLREFIQSSRPEFFSRVLLLRDVADGVQYLHHRKPPICHGDLKSLNILVNPDKSAVITDFGSAHTLDVTPEKTAEDRMRMAKIPSVGGERDMEPLKVELAPSGKSITLAGCAWTLRWAAPELLNGGSADLTSDIWAFGWICWETLTSTFPFAEDNDIGATMRILNGDLPTLASEYEREKASGLCSLMAKCWSQCKSERPSAAICRNFLQEVNVQDFGWKELRALEEGFCVYGRRAAQAIHTRETLKEWKQRAILRGEQVSYEEEDAMLAQIMRWNPPDWRRGGFGPAISPYPPRPDNPNYAPYWR